MPISTQSKNLYKKLQKRYSRKINLNLDRINLALKKLGNIHKSINNPINIIGSDGKYSTLKSLQYFIEENKEKVSNILKENSVYFEVLGKTQKEYFDLDKEFNIKLADLIHLNSCWFKNYFKEN